MQSRIAEWQVVPHGINTSDYFQGHGIALTEYTHTATGCGHNPDTALDDALENLAQADLETDAIDWEAFERDIRIAYPAYDDPKKNERASVSAYHEAHNPMGSDPEACNDDYEDCDHYFYLSIDALIETGKAHNVAI